MAHAGTAVPIVLIPGVQGRWEWMAPAARALRQRHRLITGSLCGEPGSGCRFDPAAGVEADARQIDGWLDRAGLGAAALCGVSFGGVIALHYAATRPERVRALVLVSTPWPGWRPDARQARYLRRPWLWAPAFLARAPLNMLPEIAAACGTPWGTVASAAGHVGRVLAAPASIRRMAARGRLAACVDLAAECGEVVAPTLVVTGEAHLDRVVPPTGTREYLKWLPGATAVVFERTGHIGLVTRPNRFAEIVGGFVEQVTSMIHHIPGPAGRLEALLDEPTACTSTGVAKDDRAAREVSPLRPRAAVVLAHPHPLYGGTMHNKVVFRAAKAFCALGCAVLRFNFRGTGTSEGAFDHGPGELEDFRRALDFVAARYPGTPLWVAGVSFGAWVAMTAGATDERVTRLVGVAPPVALYDFSAVRMSPKPKFLIHGERDDVCPLGATRVFYQQMAEPKELVVIDAADHLFDGHVGEVGDAIRDLLENDDDPAPGLE